MRATLPAGVRARTASREGQGVSWGEEVRVEPLCRTDLVTRHSQTSRRQVSLHRRPCRDHRPLSFPRELLLRLLRRRRGRRLSRTRRSTIARQDPRRPSSSRTTHRTDTSSSSNSSSASSAETSSTRPRSRTTDRARRGLRTASRPRPLAPRDQTRHSTASREEEDSSSTRTTSRRAQGCRPRWEEEGR